MSFGQFSTGAEASWVWTVSGVKCLYTKPNTYHIICGHTKVEQSTIEAAQNE